MNIKLISGLSGLGLAMGFITIYLPSKVEPFLWLIVFIISALQIGQSVKKRIFLHGFLLSLANSAWVAAVHISLLAQYLAHHTKEAAQYAKLTSQVGLTPAMAIVVMAPVIGSLSGLVQGLFATIAFGFYSDR